MDATASSGLKPVENMYYVDLLDEMLHPTKRPEQSRFLQLTNQLGTYILKAENCGSLVVTDPYGDCDTALMQSDLWAYRSKDDIDGMLSSVFFKEWTTRKLKPSESPIDPDFFRRFGGEIIRPALRSSGQNYFLEQSWTPQLLELRAKVLCMLGPIETRQKQLEQAENFGPLYSSVVMPLFKRLWDEDKVGLDGASKDDKLETLAAAKSCLERWTLGSEALLGCSPLAQDFVERRIEALQGFADKVRELQAQNTEAAKWLEEKSNGGIDTCINNLRDKVQQSMLGSLGTITAAVKAGRL